MSDKIDLNVFEKALKLYVKPIETIGGARILVNVVVEGDEVCVSINDVPVIRVIGEPGPPTDLSSLEERVSKLEKKI